MLALPDGLGTTLTAQQGPAGPGGEIDMLLIAAAPGELMLPAPFAGTVVAVRPQGRIATWIQIQQGKLDVALLISSSSTVGVHEGDVVHIGVPLAVLSYQADSPPQRAFEDVGHWPPGTIAILVVQDVTAGPGRGFGQLTVDSVIKDSAGGVLTVPVVAGGLTAPTAPLASPVATAAIHYVVQPGVRPADEALIRASVAAAVTYLRTTFGSARDDAVINILASKTTFDPRPAVAQSGCCTELAGGNVYLDVDDPGWPTANADKMKAAAHEYIHTFQDGLGGPFGCIGRDTDNPKRTPVWFYEGWAEYVAYQVALRNGWYTQTAVATVLQRAKADATTTSLRMISVPPLRGARGLYTLGWVAADRLTALGGVTGMREFCIAVGRGGPWQGEFQKAFAVDPDAFQDTFNSYVLALPN